MTPGEVVNAFFAALERRDTDAALALLSDDAVLDFVPVGAVKGRGAIRSRMVSFFAIATQLQVDLHRQLEDGSQVMHERTDRFEMNGLWGEIPIAGIFEVHEGKITLWRDYFDLPTFEALVAKPG
jgi:limonene-1,2-epoxide hydrolase